MPPELTRLMRIVSIQTTDEWKMNGQQLPAWKVLAEEGDTQVVR